MKGTASALRHVKELGQQFRSQRLIHTAGQTRQQLVRTAETFNDSLSLHVETRRVYDGVGRRQVIYRGQMDHRSIAVIWRESEGCQGKPFQRDKDLVATAKLTEGADQAVANGDTASPDARALESIFKAPMCAPVEAGQ